MWQYDRLLFNIKVNEYVCIPANAWPDGVQSTTSVEIGLGLEINVTICEIVFQQKK